MSYTVELTPFEQAVARALAKKRGAANRESGVADQRVGPQSSEKTDLIGAGAEIAFAKLQNIYPDFSTHPRCGTPDCVVAGLTVDVKGTDYPNGRLYVGLNKRLGDADLYALVVSVDGVEALKVWRWAGWRTATEVLRQDNVQQLKHSRAHVLEQHELIRDITPSAVLVFGGGK